MHIYFSTYIHTHTHNIGKESGMTRGVATAAAI